MKKYDMLKRVMTDLKALSPANVLDDNGHKEVEDSKVGEEDEDDKHPSEPGIFIHDFFT